MSSDNKTKYVALTIGPIYNTFQKMKSTKAIWGASYFFSYLMKTVIAKLKKDTQFLIPYVDEIEDQNGSKIDLFATPNALKVGLFPDRLIALSQEDTYERLTSAIQNTVNTIASGIQGDLKNGDIVKFHKDEFSKSDKDEFLRFILGLDQTQFIDFLNQYLQTYCIEVELNEDENPILSINNYLDTLELQFSYLQKEEYPFLVWFFENIYYNFLVRESFGEKGVRFPSVIEVATQKIAPKEDSEAKDYGSLVIKLLKSDQKKAQQVFLEGLADKFKVKQRHKYIALVQADGDNVGKLITAINDANKHLDVKDRFTRFSAQLLKFSFEASKKISDFGGMPVFAGGDDLLFFTPLIGTDGQSLMDLIRQIDQEFNDLIVEDDQLKSIISKIEHKPSMSYGIAHSYYKYPLNEALANSSQLLFNVSKNVYGKNAISFSVLKHSGQPFSFVLQKEGQAYAAYEALLGGKVSDKEDKILHSIIHKLGDYSSIIEQIFIDVSDIEMVKSMLDNFMANNFDEDIHAEKPFKSFLAGVSTLIRAVFTEETYQNMNTEEKLEQVYGALRYIKFLNAKYQDEQ